MRRSRYLALLSLPALSVVAVLAASQERVSEAGSDAASAIAERVPSAEGVVTLYALDHLQYSFVFPTQSSGTIVQDGVVYNHAAQLDYGRIVPQQLTLGCSGGELGCLRDLGDLRHDETGFSSFAAIDCDGTELRWHPKATEFDGRIAGAIIPTDQPLRPSFSIAPEVGHIYVGRLRNVYQRFPGHADRSTLLVALRVLEHRPGAAITLRWKAFGVRSTDG
ncbi:MAG: hypothetical protein IPN34_25115 [Planctomycetes bacterium]|nr:hypothetical protein [Planctomycetota bacterium]